VVRLAYSVLGDSQRAEDVAQEVFLGAYRRFAGSPEQAAGWVRVGAVHGALNALRGERRRERRHRELPFRSDALPSAEQLALERESRAELRAALARLPHRSAAVVVMRHGGMSYAEIAAALGIKVGNVGTTLKRAESALCKELNRHARNR
jgi:RNA polymerase sigma factor (sigma-70 family)